MSEMLSTDQWKAKDAGLSLQNKAFIGCQYVASASGKTFDCISPCDGTLLTQVACEKGDLRNMAPKDRKTAPMRFAQSIEATPKSLR